MRNYISPQCSLKGSLSIEGSLTGDVSISGSDEKDIYDGEYDITPSTTNDQILQTKGKVLKNDITVFKIPYTETSNVADGMTVYIGG